LHRLPRAVAGADAIILAQVENATWLDHGHVVSSLRKEFVFKYLLRSAYFNHISAVQRLVDLYEVGKYRPENAKKSHCYDIPLTKKYTLPELK
jgi:hypothetical protein